MTEPVCAPARGSPQGARLTEIGHGFSEPTFVAAAPGDDERLYVLERAGAIRLVQDGEAEHELFLDLTAKVTTAGEAGLIGLAFHPRYADNKRFFVQYATAGTSTSGALQVVLSEFVHDATERLQERAERERVLMIVEQPSNIHLGGMLAFGPHDGMLYIGRGDAGSGRARDSRSWLGKILRIDVDAATAPRSYGVPVGNMTGQNVLPEIWSVGLRNPWRFSFDPCTADMYIGDVGEAQFEEINLEPPSGSGRDYGWNLMEGSACLGNEASCDRDALTPPALVYSHAEFGCAVIGGYVYRGSRIPSLRGTYLYADYCSGGIGAMRAENGRVLNASRITRDVNPDRIALITSFGMDNSGELYVVTLTGELYRLDPE